MDEDTSRRAANAMRDISDKIVSELCSLQMWPSVKEVTELSSTGKCALKSLRNGGNWPVIHS